MSRARHAVMPGPAPARTGYRRFVDYPRTGRRGWRALVPSWRLTAGIAAGGVLAVVGLITVAYALVQVPDAAHLKMPTATVYEYSDGTVFYTAGLQNRVVVPLSQVPPAVQQAVVSVENPTFYTDSGISLRGTARALVNDLEGRPLQGGSTITQQFVKNAYLTDQQTLRRKLSEIFIAVKLTRTYSKRQILGDYFSTVYFGRQSYGVDAAARTYFGVPVDRITDPARAAYLAALVNEPTVLSRTDPADQAQLRRRWNLVLDDMVKTGDLTRAQRAAVRWPHVLAPSTGIIRDSHGVDDSAMAQVANGYLDELHAQDPAVPDSATADAGGDVIVTTFSQAGMAAAVRAVSQGLYSRLKPGAGGLAAVDRGVQAGLAAVGTRTGELLAFYPGRSDFDNATQAQITPGSQMQAFSEAARLPGPGTDPGHSATSLWDLMSRIGLTQNLVADPAELPEPLAKLKQDPLLAQGIAPESPARMADAFSVFADGGVYRDLTMALSVTVAGHHVWHYQPPAGTRVLTPLASRLAGKVLVVGGDGLDGSKAVGIGPVFSPDGTLETAAVAGMIGGDDAAWYSGIGNGVALSVGLWDQSVGPHGRVVTRSLDGLGGVPASGSSTWPLAIWLGYLKGSVRPTAVPAASGVPAEPAAPVTPIPTG